MNNERYTRQTILKGFGPEGQRQLAAAKVLVVGAGGLGVPVLTYLNAMGVGTLGIVDGDVVSVTNLHRQVLYGQADVGQPKAQVAREKLLAQNPDGDIHVYLSFLTPENALEIISGYDVVVDASDNFPTRYLVNDACAILKKPFVYGALHGFEGQLSVFNYRGGPTYRCLFPTMPKQDEVPNCGEHGVLGIVPGIVGNLQALETIKVITGIGEVLSGIVLLFEGLHQTYHKIKFKLRPENKAIKVLQESYGWMDPCEVLPSVTAQKLDLLLEQNEQIVDVRTPEEFRAYHLPRSLHIPLNELEDRLPEIDFSKPVYLLCQSGVRSAQALKTLRKRHPQTSFYNVLGGVSNYLALCS